MKKRYKIPLFVVLFLFLLLWGILLIPSQGDYGTFLKMRDYGTQALKKAGAVEKPINNDFVNYKLNLPFLYRIMFKSPNLSLYLKSYESDKIDTASINQLEIGNDTGNFFDFTFLIRPRSSFNVPLFHGDALKALPGVTAALYMDFYSLNNSVDFNTFFSVSREKIERAMALAEPYWKHKDFGALTPYLNPYKSPYRLEMVEPKGSAEEKRQYYQTVLACYSLYTDAYLEALDAWNTKEDEESRKMREKETRNFVSILYREDIAVKMGKMIFPEKDFDRYFLDGFWGTGPLGIYLIR